MNTAFYTGRSGLFAYQTDIDVKSHNISNANTYGYKYTNVEFNELLLDNMNVNINREKDNEADKIKVGNGVYAASDELIFEQGALVSTGYDLDFAIVGDALFALQDKNGNIQYTKNGAFDISVENTGNYLIASDGSYVLDKQGNRIEIPYDEYGHIDKDAINNALGIYTFDNCYGLERIDNARFLQTDISGEAKLAPQGLYSIYNNSLERSNTSLAKEMADVIVSQKAYQFSARVISVSDEIEQVANNLRK